MELEAEKREILGSKVNRLRRGGQMPAVVFGQGKPSLPVVVAALPFRKLYNDVGESQLIDLKLEGETPRKVLISEVQTDPVTGDFLHANFHEVKLTEKLTATVPIEVKGESPAVKSGAGILLTILDEVEVECLPTDLPAKISVDICGLTEVGQGVAIKDLPVDRSKVAIQQEPDDLVLKIDYPQMEEEAEEAVSEAEAVAGVEATAEKVGDEGEAEGAAKEEKPASSAGGEKAPPEAAKKPA